MQTTGIASVAPQMNASTGIAPNLSGMDKEMLAMAILGRVPGVQPASALGELNKLVEAEKLNAAAQGQQAMAQGAAMQQQPPVAQQILQQAMSSGIGAQPYEYADGGVVGFQTAGAVEDPYPANGQELQRIGAQYGIVLSPYDAPDVQVKKIQEIKQLIESAKQMQENRAEIPTPDSEANRLALQAAFADPSRRMDVLSARLPPQQSTPIPGARVRPDEGVATTLDDDVGDAQRQLLDIYGQQTGVTEDELSKRKDLYKRLEEVQKDRMQRAEGKQRGIDTRRAAIGQRPSRLVSSLLAGTKGAKRFNEALVGSVISAREYEDRRRKEMAEEERGLRDEEATVERMKDAADDLKTAMLEKELAYASNDAAAKRAADIKVAEARATLATTERAFKLEQYKAREQAESQRMQAEAARTTAGAAVTRAGHTGTSGPKPMSEKDRAALETKVRSSVQKGFNSKYAEHLMESRAKKTPPMSRQAYEDYLVKQQLDGMLGAGTQSAGTGSGQRVIAFNDIGVK